MVRGGEVVAGSVVVGRVVGTVEVVVRTGAEVVVAGEVDGGAVTVVVLGACVVLVDDVDPGVEVVVESEGGPVVVEPGTVLVEEVDDVDDVEDVLELDVLELDVLELEDVGPTVQSLVAVSDREPLTATMSSCPAAVPT
ncbi:MAG: hypothetical protein R2746_07955 [Acidimicrobiales bacterium]